MYKLPGKLGVFLLMLLFAGTAYAFEPTDYDWVRSDLYLGGEEQIEYTLVSYGSAGKRSSEESFSFDGELDGKTKYSYDAKGRISKVENLDAKGKLEDYLEKKYDDAGNLVREDTYNRRGKLEAYTTYEYDSSNKLIKSRDYSKKGKIEGTMRVAKHDKRGNPLEMEIFEEGGREPEVVIINTFNSKNKLSKLVFFSVEDDLPLFEVRYTYEN